MEGVWNVLLVPKSSRTADLEELAEQIRHDKNLAVAIQEPHASGYQVTWWEVVIIYLATKGADAVVGRSYAVLMDHVIESAKRWHTKRRAATASNRPLSITLCNRLGRVLRALKFEPTGEVVDVPAEDRPKTLRLPRNKPPEPEIIPDLTSREKHLTTIAYCDISNSTELLTKVGARRVHGWLGECRREWSKIVEAKNGVVFYSHRDNLAAYFADITGQQDCAERALLSAFEIVAAPKSLSKQRVLRRAKVRVGLATGVLSPYQLRPTRTTNKTYSLASALSLVSRDNFIAFDPTTKSLISSKFKVQDCGRKVLIGRKKPIHFWQALV